MLACVPLHLLARFLLPGGSRWPRRFLRWAGWLCGARVRVVGAPLDRDVFYVANHMSWLDILALGGATGCAFVSRDDIGRAPVLGWLAAQNGTILVSRTERGAVRGQIGALRDAMARHQPVTLFPEGTTGDGHSLLPFKPALFAVLLPPPRAIRVQPVLIDYGVATDDIAWIDDEPGIVNAARVLGRRRTPVVLRFLEPFDPGEHPDRKAMAAEARARIETAWVRDGWAG
ncbi:1-acyl-sn-glycerol-3-phosphate acyltransferase [Sphingobium sufflavum]|nr:1-acyl-sn-glycerol-3-phosphate acyltransferase [Sphingobium sufflavum]